MIREALPFVVSVLVMFVGWMVASALAPTVAVVGND